MTDSKVKVRIAPSPSGYVHVGTARMAICNFLFARHYGGEFLVRIEDTDSERSDQSLIEPILDAIRWLKCDWDGEIIRQSERIELYKGYAQKILKSGAGYRCFCSREQLEKDRAEDRKKKEAPRRHNRCHFLSQEEIDAKVSAGDEFTIRLFIPDGVTVYNDMVLGEVKRNNDDIEDFIIARSDGTAVYNLAVVVDDNDMGITHVIRGNDHVTNTFKQVHIYKALGFEEPVFGHMPLILRPDKKKVSKRLGDKGVGEYQKEGILPESLFNYLCLLGWSPKTDQEVYSIEKLIDIFTEKNFNASNAVFDEDKLVAFNKDHIAMKPTHELATIVAPLFIEADIQSKYWFETRWEYLCQVVEALKGRVRRLHDFVDMGSYFFQFDYKYEEKARLKHFNLENAELLEELANRFEKLDKFDHESAEQVITAMAEEKEFKKAKLIHPTRLATSGTSAGPGLYDLLIILTQPVVVERIRKAVEYIRKENNN